MPESGWRPKVYTCSAVAATGLEEVWKGVEEFLDHIQANGYFRHNRNRQNKYWMYESINEVLRNSFYHDPAVGAHRGVRKARAGGQNIVVHRTKIRRAGTVCLQTREYSPAPMLSRVFEP